MVSNFNVPVPMNRLRRTRGSGIGRKIAASLIRTIAPSLVNKIADAVSGGSYRLAGRGRKPRTTKPKTTRKPRKTGAGAKRKPARRIAKRCRR